MAITVAGKGITEGEMRNNRRVLPVITSFFIPDWNVGAIHRKRGCTKGSPACVGEWLN